VYPGGDLLDSYSIPSNVGSLDLYDTTGCRSVAHCLTRNLTLRFARNILSADHYCIFNQLTTPPILLAKKTSFPHFRGVVKS
jgi:hypothetical protein